MHLVVFFYRFSNFLYTNGFKLISRLFSVLTRFIFSCWVPGSAQIGENLKLGYGGLGVVIHSNTKIGKNVTIGQNVTIGRNFGDKKVPEIGDDVYIGSGSVIFGEIKIGNNVIIGSNSLINKNVPNDSTVVGNPMKIIKHNRTKKYYELDKNI